MRRAFKHSGHCGRTGSPTAPGSGLAAAAGGLLAGALMVASPAMASVWHFAGAGGRLPSRRLRVQVTDAAAVSGGHLFVANRTGDSVTELNASSGAHSGHCPAPYDFDAPTALKAVGTTSSSPMGRRSH